MDKKIVMLCSACFSTTAVYNAVNRSFPIAHIIEEEPLRGMALAKRRAKKMGWFKVSGQISFALIIGKTLALFSKKRIAAIQTQYAFDLTPLPAEKIMQVASVNDEACIRMLKELDPDVVLVNGTRIISKKVLESTRAVFINMHTGITPAYRGVHGGYWALVNNEPERCGVTVHLVDKGIDTGGVLYQATINTTSRDNFITYPYLQFGEGIPLVKMAVEDALTNDIEVVQPPAMPSALWSHPGFWQYIYLRLFKGKK
ncbi:MAG: formyl transferase [Bacteroidetes bacterium]|nr:formyl transferase [Bacteroidota bacterium]